MSMSQDDVVNRIPAQTGGANDVRDLCRIVRSAGIDDRSLSTPDENVSIDNAQVGTKDSDWSHVLSVGNSDREIVVADDNTPAFTAEPEIELAPYCQTAAGDSGQPRSATDLLSFPHARLQSL